MGERACFVCVTKDHSPHDLRHTCNGFPMQFDIPEEIASQSAKELFGKDGNL